MQTTDPRLSRLQTAQTALQLIGFEQDREDRQAAQAAQEKAAAEQTASAFRTETYTFEAVRPETAPAASQTSEKVAPASSTAKSPRGFPVGTQGEIRPSLLLALVQIGRAKSALQLSEILGCPVEDLAPLLAKLLLSGLFVSDPPCSGRFGLSYGASLVYWGAEYRAGR
jgi:hypothetical protein